MISFKTWLKEAEFTNGKDQDYTSDDSRILVFSEKEISEYKVEGQTHGEASHSIKHLIEYDKSFVDSTINSLKEDLKKYLSRKPDSFCKIYNSRTSKFSQESGKDAVDKANINVMLNTLDMVNDIAVSNKALNKFDSIVNKYVTTFKNKYDEIINGKIGKAKDLDQFRMTGDKLVDKIKPLDVIKYSAKSGKSFAILDFTDRTLLITDSSGKVNSMFRLTCQDNKKSIIAKAFDKGFYPSKSQTAAALEKI